MQQYLLAFHATHIKPVSFHSTDFEWKIVFNTLRSMALQIKKILNRLMRKCKKRVRHGRVKKIPYSDSESDYIRIDLYIGQLMRKDMLMVMKEREARYGE